MKKEERIQSNKKIVSLTILKLFKVLGFLYHLHLLKPVTSVLHPPRNLSIVSENLHHILMWEAGEDAPFNTSYSVEYFTLSTPDRSFPAENCLLIRNRTCDLTDDFSDIHGNYWPRVKVVLEMDESNWTTMDIPFQPYDHTRIRPIKVQLVEFPLGVLSLTFDIAAPPPLISHNLNVKSLMDIYMRLQYHIVAYKDGKLEKYRELLKVTSETSIEEIFENLEPSTKYCITINIFYLKEEPYSPLERKCITTQHTNKVSEKLFILLFFILGVVIFAVITVLSLYKAGCLLFLSTFVPQSLKNLKYTHATYNYNDMEEEFSIMGPLYVCAEKMQNIEEENEKELMNAEEETVYEHNLMPLNLQSSAESSSFYIKGTDGTNTVVCDDQRCDPFTDIDDCQVTQMHIMQNESTETEIMSQLQQDHSRKSSLSSRSFSDSDVPLCSVQIQGSDSHFVEFSNEPMEICRSCTIEESDSLTSEPCDNTELNHIENPFQCDVQNCSTFPQVSYSNYIQH